MKRDSTYQAYINTLTHQAITVAMLVVTLIIMGIVGYMYIEKWPFLDALYMTVITIATVGFKEVHTMNRSGEIFTICLITSGVGVFAYGAATFSQLLVEGEFQRVFDKRRLEKEMKRLEGHVIVCGFGRLGEKISHVLNNKGEPFVVIENAPSQIAKIHELGYLYVESDTSEETALEEAGIDRAKALIAVLGSDADNLFLTISARELNPQIHIVARVDDPTAPKKLYKAGANRVVSPYDTGARMLANAALKPTISELIELSTRMGPVTMVMEEVIGYTFVAGVIRPARLLKKIFS
jgi:voltage-gated potassium channel